MLNKHKPVTEKVTANWNTGCWCLLWFFFFNILDENSYFLLFSLNWLWMTNPGSQVLGRECLEELSTLKCWISINEQSWHRFRTDLNLAELVSHAHWFLNFTKKKKKKKTRIIIWHGFLLPIEIESSLKKSWKEPWLGNRLTHVPG